jgi:hypothetical protein
MFRPIAHSAAFNRHSRAVVAILALVVTTLKKRRVPVHDTPFDARQYESASTDAKVAAFLPVQVDRHRAPSPSAGALWTGPLR